MVIKINGTEYNIKTSFVQLTWSEFVSAIESNGLKRVSVLSSIPIELLESMPLTQLSEIINTITFFDSVDEIATYSKPYTSDLSVGSETYGKIEKAKALLKKYQSNTLKAGAEIVKTYTGEDISSKPVTDVYNMVAFFLPR